MSLVPPKELESILADVSTPLSFSTTVADNIGRLVTEGFRSWSSFDEQYRKQADEIRAASPGEAHWADVASFMVKFANAKDGQDAMFGTFAFADDEIVAVEECVPTILIENKPFACGDTGGLRATYDDGSVTGSLGLNIESVQRSLRNTFSSPLVTGAAYLNKPAKFCDGMAFEGLVYVQCFLRQKILNDSGRWLEQSCSICVYVFDDKCSPIELTGKDSAGLIRHLMSAQRIKEPSSIKVRDDLVDTENALLSRLRQPSDEEIGLSIRYSVWPLATVVLR